MTVNNYTHKLIEKLIWETITGDVTWEFGIPPGYLTAGTSDLVPTYIRTRYKGKQEVAVYERRYKYYTDVDEWSWSVTIVFVLVDDYGRVIFETKDSDVSVNNLFDVARESASGVSGIIKSLVDDE